MITIRHYLTAAFVLAVAATAHAQVVTPNPAPTIIKTAPYTISAPGYYQLGADLTVSASSGNIITIAASNVTLDFGGHYISGPSAAPASTLVGVYAHEEGNLTVRNGTIAFCYQGVDLEGTGNANSLNINQHVDNMLVSYCYYAAIYLNYASNTVISNNRLSFVTGSSQNPFADGIYFESGTGNKAIGNEITNVHALASDSYGIVAYNSGLNATANDVSNVDTAASSNHGHGIAGTIFAEGNTVSNCYYGLTDAGKYTNNLTNVCTTAFTGGTAVGYNN